MEKPSSLTPPSDFPRQPGDFLAELQGTDRPVKLTIDGEAEWIVQDPASRQTLLDLAERLETIQAAKEAAASIDRGEGRPMDEVFDALEQELLRKSRG